MTQEKSFYFIVELSINCENVMSAASESTMRPMSGSVTEN